jgi:hypothetical protein
MTRFGGLPGWVIIMTRWTRSKVAPHPCLAALTWPFKCQTPRRVFRPKQLELNMHESTLSPTKKCELTRDLSTPEGRAFWAVAERARERVAAWPEWKRNLKVLRDEGG